MFRYQQMIYIYLLQRYLLLRYRSEWESEKRFEKLMNYLEDIVVFGKNIRKQFINKKRCIEFPPLLQEILS